MKSIIGGKWKESSSGNVIDVLNPATGEVIDVVPSLTVDEVNSAVEGAFKAQKAWGNKLIVERCEILAKFVNLVLKNKDILAKTLSCETGKSIREAYNEINNVQIGVPSYIEKAKHEYGNLIYRGSECDQDGIIQYTIRQPLGVVAVIISFDFPSDIFVNKVIPALLMGNSVVLMPSSLSPLLLTRYVEFLVKAGIPNGVISIVHGEGSIIGKALAKHPKVDLVSLAGNTETGIDVLKNCASHCARSILSLSGNDVFILCEDGDMDLAIEESVLGRFYNAGQSCSASKRFLVHNSVKAEYIKRMSEKIKSLKVGMPSDPETDIGCLISEEAAKEVDKQVQATVKEGAKVVVGGKRNGAFYEPTILDGITRYMDVAKDMEIYGPVISVIGFDTLDEAIDIANQSKFGLSGAVITRDINTAIKVSERIECGSFVINGSSLYRSFEQPFGGCKYSGMGNEGVMSSLNEMSRIKTVVLKNIVK